MVICVEIDDVVFLVALQKKDGFETKSETLNDDRWLEALCNWGQWNISLIMS